MNQRFWKIIHRSSISNDEELDWPYIYLIPKMNKNPSKHQFIEDASKCSTKPLSILLTKCLHILSKVLTAKQPTQEVE